MKRLLNLLLLTIICCSYSIQLNAQEYRQYSLRGLVSIYQIQKDSSELEDLLPLVLQILNTAEKEYDNQDTVYAKIVHRLAKIYDEMDSLNQAINYYQIAKKIQEQKIPEQLSYAITLGDLGLAYYYVGEDLLVIEQLWLKGIGIYKKVLGEHHPLYATGLNYLSNLYADMGEMDKSIFYFKKTVALRKEILGPKHLDYARSLNNLGSLYWDTGAYIDALPLYEEELEIRKEVLGAKSPKYLLNLSDIGSLYSDIGDLDQALVFSRMALEIRKETLGENGTEYSASLNNLGNLYIKKGNYEEALLYLRLALKITKEKLGEKTQTMRGFLIIWPLSIGKWGVMKRLYLFLLRPRIFAKKYWEKNILIM